MSPRQPIDVDAIVEEAKTTHKLLPVKRDTYLGFEGYPGFVDFRKDLNLSQNDVVKLLIILSGVKKQPDLLKDARVREALRALGKKVPQ